MAKLLKLRRGTTSQHNTFTGAEGEVTIDTTKDTAVVHDGSTAGGRPLAREDMSNVSSSSIASRLGADSIATTKIAAGALPTDVTIASANIVNGTIAQADMGASSVGTSQLAAGAVTNDKVSSSAAIAGTKISPNFGSQNITTTGTITSNDITILDQQPRINFVDNAAASGGSHNPDYLIQVDGGSFVIHDSTNQRNSFKINPDGHVDFPLNVDCGAGLDVTGNISVTGTVDGRDIASLGNKIDGIENGATADQTASEILTLLKTVDGSGSGLDADTLDGISSGSFLRSDATDTATGTLNVRDIKFTAGYHLQRSDHHSGHFEGSYNSVGPNSQKSNPIYTIGSSYNPNDASLNNMYGVGYAHGDASFNPSGAGWGFYVAADGDRRLYLDASNGRLFLGAQDTRYLSDCTGQYGSVQINGQGQNSWEGFSIDGRAVFMHDGGTSTGIYNDVDNEWLFYAIHNGSSYMYHNNSNKIEATSGGAQINGSLTATGNVTAYSDARLKTNVNTINDALSIVGKLRGVSFDWKESGKHSIGLIAQEVEEVLPELVLDATSTDPQTKKETTVKTVDYGKIVGVLINAINELKAEVDELKGGK